MQAVRKGGDDDLGCYYLLFNYRGVVRRRPSF
jgi:hypothetical protein